MTIPDSKEKFESRQWRIFGFFLFGFRKSFRDWSSGYGRIEYAGEDPGTLYSALYGVFCDQDQEVCPLILPKLKADRPRIGKDGILPMKRTRRQLDMLTHRPRRVAYVVAPVSQYLPR